jgi:hypothetical protein
VPFVHGAPCCLPRLLLGLPPRARRAPLLPLRPRQLDDEYYIRDYDLPISRFVSVPRAYEGFNPGTLVAGMMRGMLDAAGFPCR